MPPSHHDKARSAASGDHGRRVCGKRERRAPERLAQLARLRPDRARSALSPRHLFLAASGEAFLLFQRDTTSGAGRQSGAPSAGWWRKLSPPLARAIGPAATVPCRSAAVNLPGRPGYQVKVDDCERIEMSNFDADDMKVYKGWLRRTLAIYAGMVLLGGCHHCGICPYRGAELGGLSCHRAEPRCALIPPARRPDCYATAPRPVTPCSPPPCRAPPARPRGARSARGTASTTRSRGRPRGRTRPRPGRRHARRRCRA